MATPMLETVVEACMRSSCPRGGYRETLDRAGFELEFDEDFAGPELDPGRWIAHYLPHWTTPERSAARYDLHPGMLRLRIDADQPAWRAEDGEMRVSNLQTGTFSGPAGSRIGQHRHRGDLTVTSPQPTRRDRKSTRLNSSHANISYAVFCLKKKKNINWNLPTT